MSSNPHGMRFSPFATGAQTPQQQLPVMKVPPKPKQYVVNTTSNNNLSGSDTDESTSNENLSKEERYVIKHTARVEPQGQENLIFGKTTPVADNNQARAHHDQQMRFSSNTSSDSTRYATPTSQRSVSEVKGNTNNNNNNNAAANQSSGNLNDSNRSSLIASTNSNRNSLKECNSNRSSMDVSQSSYNTLIIHNDDSMYYDYSTPPPSYNTSSKKDRPRSFGEREQQTDGLTEIPEEYLKQSHVLKHLAKEVGLAKNFTDASGAGYNSNDDGANGGRAKSKSQPDLTNLTEVDCEDIESLIKENQQLREQLNTCQLKLSKTQKLQSEINNIQREYEALVQSNERRERLERNARSKLQNELRHSQEINRVLREQCEALQQQLMNLPEHHLDRTQQDVRIAQLTAQNKELAEENKRYYIEIQAQNATLEDQRVHINILDTAIQRMEEENRQKQLYVERCKQLQHALQSLQNANERRENSEHKMLLDTFGADLNANSGVSDVGNMKWQLREKDNQIICLKAECAKLEQRNMDDTNVSRNVSKMASEQRQEADRILAEAKQEKLRHLDEAHLTSRKLAEMQEKLKMMGNRLAEKDAIIRTLQGKNLYGNNSFNSYNLSTDSFALNPLGYNSQASFDVSNNSFDISNPSTSLLDPNTYGPSSSSASISTTYSPNYGQTNPTYNQSAINLQSMNYSPISSGYGSNVNYVPSSANFTQGGLSYDVQRRSIDDQLKQLDEALMSKRGLCCFPLSSPLGSKKQIHSILNDGSGQLSSNNSETLLTGLKHVDHRNRSRERQDPENKPDEMVLLVKQGISSQNIRNNTIGNLAQVTQNVGQNMTDISNIGGGKRSPSPNIKNLMVQNNLQLPPRNDRGTSLPPPRPRPPRSLKPPRKIEYGRLGEVDFKKRSQTPPTPQQEFELKTSSLKRGEYVGGMKHSGKDLTENMKLNQKHKNYGAVASSFGFKSQSEFTRPDYTSTRNYQRLDEPRKISLIPNPRKVLAKGNGYNQNKGSRESLNSASSGSNNSNNSNTLTPVRQSPVHNKTDSNSSTSMGYGHQLRSQYTPPAKPSFIASAKSRLQNQFNQKSSSLPSASILHASTSGDGLANASRPPQGPVDAKMKRRGHSIARGENKYEIMQYKI